MIRRNSIETTDRIYIIFQNEVPEKRIPNLSGISISVFA